MPEGGNQGSSAQGTHGRPLSAHNWALCAGGWSDQLGSAGGCHFSIYRNRECHDATLIRTLPTLERIPRPLPARPCAGAEALCVLKRAGARVSRRPALIAVVARGICLEAFAQGDHSDRVRALLPHHYFDIHIYASVTTYLLVQPIQPCNTPKALSAQHSQHRHL